MVSHKVENGSTTINAPESSETSTNEAASLEKRPNDVEAQSSIQAAHLMYIGSFPEGGLRAWAVVIGAAGVLFCNFGYSNAFG
jgi:hypothetical protein